jgi:hypothetical protein
MAIKTHLSKVRPNAFGGHTYGTLCNRYRVMADGMNLTSNEAEVTCSFCLKMLAAKATRERRAA